MAEAMKWNGLREVLQGLNIVDHAFYNTLLVGLNNVGETVRVQARKDFIDYGSLTPKGDPASSKRQASFVKSADGFDTRVRPNTSTSAIVGIGQKLRKTQDIPRRRPNFGDLQMRHGLLQARGEKAGEAYEILETEVAGLLHANGF